MPRTREYPVPQGVALLWIAHLLLVPFYIFDSGLPQPADGVALIFAISTFFACGLHLGRLSNDIRSLIVFVWYVVCVGVFNALFTEDMLLLRVPAFYIFNGLVACACAVLFVRCGNRFLVLTVVGISLSALLQVVLIPVAPLRDSIRATLFFNNPNQLGYFAVMCACFAVLPVRLSRKNRVLQIVALVCCAILSLLSLSKSALGAIAVLLVVTFIRRRGMMLLACALIAVLYVALDSRELSIRVYDRLTVGQDDDSLSGRGYDRIVRHPEYLILGAGEGATHRFETEFKGEIHSSFGTVVFSYGLVGVGLFLAFFVPIVRRRPSFVLAALSPVAIYGLTHNGLRSTLAWEYVVAVLFVAERRSLPTGGQSERSRSLPVPRTPVA